MLSVHDPGRPPVLAVRFYLLVLGQNSRDASVHLRSLSPLGRFAIKYRRRLETEAEEPRVESSKRNLELENLVTDFRDT